jgi:hypothetical protein
LSKNSDAVKLMLVAAASFRKQGGHKLKSEIERSHYRRAANALGHAK